MSDSQLIEKLKVGNPQAVREWFSRCHQPLLTFVLYKIDSPQDAEELVQETFIQCLKHLPLFNGTASIMTWMQSVARHEIADYYRKKYAKRALRTLPLHQLLESGAIADVHEVSEKVKSALSTMRRDYRELLLLKYIDGKSVKDIANELDKTVKSVEADLFRARQHFKELYATVESS